MFSCEWLGQGGVAVPARHAVLATWGCGCKSVTVSLWLRPWWCVCVRGSVVVTVREQQKVDVAMVVSVASSVCASVWRSGSARG